MKRKSVGREENLRIEECSWVFTGLILGGGEIIDPRSGIFASERKEKNGLSV